MKRKYVYLIAFIIAVIIAGFVFFGKSNKAIAPTPTEDGSNVSSLPTLLTQNEFLNIVNPKANQTITSPLTIKGFAKGVWYFEASFPVSVVDSKGEIIGQGIAQAQEDWMTEKFVPFSGTIIFTGKEGEKGFVVFKKDNPSGLRENDNEIRVPVIFGKGTMPITVYFGNRDKGSNGDCSNVFPIVRSVTKTTSVALAALTELLSGTTELERKDNYYSSINDGVKIQKLTIENGVAKVDFSSEIEKAVGGSCRVNNIRAQIEKTLRNFSSVQSVDISIDGRTKDILQP